MPRTMDPLVATAIAFNATVWFENLNAVHLEVVAVNRMNAVDLLYFLCLMHLCITRG